MLTRRALLQGMLTASGVSLLPLGGRGWAMAAPGQANRRLIVILMRGAVDGLSIVAPYGEPYYYRARPTIALPPPSQNGLIDLDGFFGLHSSLASLAPLWSNRSLAFIHASGSPATTRSHFEAQDILETAMLNSAMASQGWMNGLAQALPDNHSSMRSLSLGNTLPKIFQGRFNVTTVPPELEGNRQTNLQDTQTQQAFSQMYGEHTELGGLYRQATSARATISKEIEHEMNDSARGAPGADGFAKQTRHVANMIRRDSGIQLVFMDVGGWDTHVNQGNVKGQLANKLENFGAGLAALANGLGDAYQDTAILVMSEFGRTVAENGNAGTDHGHGNVAWLMGGAVQGGKVWGNWPGLNPNHLYENRDLAVTTDFRSIIGALLQGHLGIDAQNLAGIIPGYTPDPVLNGILG